MSSGTLSAQEAQALHHLVHACAPGDTVVEVSNGGGASIGRTVAVPAGVHVAAIDALSKAVSDTFCDIGSGPIALLFIDGTSRAGPVSAAIGRWGARVRPGGMIALHGAFCTVGATVAVGYRLVFGERFRYAGRCESLAIYHADLDGTLRSRAVNAARQLAELGRFVGNLATRSRRT